MTLDELVEELREMGEHPCRAHLPMGATLREAATHIEALKAEKLKSLALQDLAYQNGAQQYAAIAAQSPEEAEKWLQNLSRRSDGLKVLNDAKQTLEGTGNG